MNSGGGVKVVNARLRLHKNPWKTQVLSRPDLPAEGVAQVHDVRLDKAAQRPRLGEGDRVGRQVDFEERLELARGEQLWRWWW